MIREDYMRRQIGESWESGAAIQHQEIITRRYFVIRKERAGQRFISNECFILQVSEDGGKLP